MQGQNPRDPYVALWSRLVDFDPSELEGLLLDRQVVRLVVQRGTVHVVTADDCLVLRPLAQPILLQQLRAHSLYKGRFDGVDLEAVMDSARRILAEQPRNAKQLREALAERFPDVDADGDGLRLPQPAGVRPGAATRVVDDVAARSSARPPRRGSGARWTRPRRSTT